MSLLLACLAVQFAASPARADEASESAFSLQGFGTLGVARTTSNNVEFVRDLSQARGVHEKWNSLIDSVLGVQASWRVNPQLEAVVQATSRYRYDKTFTPEIAWAYLKYDPTPNLSLRAGRLGTDFFMLADSRWVGYSFLTVRPPGDYFWFLPFYSIRGADAAISIPLGDDIVRFKAFYGHSDGKIPLANEQWDIAGSPMSGAYLEYQHGPWQIRGAYADIRFERDLPIAKVLNVPPVAIPLALDFLTTAGTRSHYYSLGVVYDRGPWQGQLMLNHIEQGSNAFESSDGGYVLLGYRVAEVTPYLGYSWIRSYEKSRLASGSALNDSIAIHVMQDSHADQATTIVGLRWDIARNLALKAQWDAINGKASSIFPYRQDNRASWDGQMNVFSLTMDFIF